MQAIESVIKNLSYNKQNLRMGIIAYRDTRLFQRAYSACPDNFISPQVIAINTNIKLNVEDGQLVHLKFEKPKVIYIKYDYVLK